MIQLKNDTYTHLYTEKKSEEPWNKSSPGVASEKGTTKQFHHLVSLMFEMRH